MTKGILNIATCQFAVGSSIEDNAAAIKEYMRKAAQSNADVVHFSECALSGYVGTDFANFNNFDWNFLRGKTTEIMALAKELKIWVVLGSVHELTAPNKPHNSLYIINNQGKIVDRYDKRFCTRADLRRHKPGNRFVFFTINGIKCSALICFDLRFPEIYRELYKNQVNCIFQSFYNARQKGTSVHTDIMRQTMQAHAASNYFWVSMSNSSGYYAPYPSCFIEPDGKIAGQLEFNTAGIMTNTLDIAKKYYDPSAKFRELAINGILCNGETQIDDPRSIDTKNL